MYFHCRFVEINKAKDMDTPFPILLNKYKKQLWGTYVEDTYILFQDRNALSSDNQSRGKELLSA